MVSHIASLLRTIKSSPLEEVQSRLISIACEWMAAGCVQHANRLLTVTRETGDLSQFSNPLKGFEIPWSLTGTRPEGWPIAAQPIDDIELELWDRLFRPSWAQAVVESVRAADPNDLVGQRLLIRGVITAYDDARPSRVAPPAMLTQAAALLDRFVASGSSDAVGYSLFQALSCNAILAVRLGQVDRAKEILAAWGRSYALYPASWIVWYPMMDRSIVKILLSKILAPVWGVSRERCDADVEAIAQAVRERLASGRQLAHASLRWPQLLKRLSHSAVLAEAHDRDGGDKPQTLACGAAAAGVIAAAESRLGCILPESYRGFLTVSNGFGLYSRTGVEILPIERGAWLREACPALIDAYAQSEQLADLTKGLQASLLIGRGPSDEQLLLLVPDDDTTAEWECWFVAHWLPGEERYPSFRYFIESKLNRLEDAPPS